ncbi:MAG: flagellin [Acidobacteria bacterium]|nr:flagellin [Acidobacteriota bacterium]MBI3662975.1 flagellin [Acidobacteriota bacterium]
MALSILNNIPSLAASNQLSITGANLQSTLFRLSSGSRINSGADDAAGLAIADGLRANVTGLSQSARNANDGVGQLQVADGALAQVTNLLNRAVTLATEASTGTVSSSQRTALNSEFVSIKAEIDRIGSKTTFNGTSVFSATATSIFLSDASSNSTIAVTVGALSSSAIGSSSPVDLSVNDLTTAANATTALGNINTAIQRVASDRGTVGASINRLQAAVNVINNQVQNLTAAEDGIRAADIAQEVANLTRFSILNQTGISALAQANSHQQSVLALLR